MVDLLAFSSISTEIVLIIASLFLVLLGLVFNDLADNSKVPSIIAIVALFAGIYIVSRNSQTENVVAFNKLFVSNNYIIFAKVIVMLSAVVSILFTMGCSALNKIYLKFEFVTLILFSVIGMLVMISANDFMTLYLGLELQTLCLYSLTCFSRTEVKSSEGALKYFILGGIASALILYGISFIYGFAGTTNFSLIAESYNYNAEGQNISIGILIGSVLVIIGFCFKIAAVPFHMWAPDVYQGALLPVTAFLSTTPKAAAILILAKLLISTFNIWIDIWQQVIKVIAGLSLFIGALGALKQKDIKRLLAYSSISHIGFILVGISAHNKAGLESVVTYVCIYISMNFGMFACVSMMQKANDENYELSIFKGLSEKNPVLAIAITILLLSLAGIPPLAGFLAKFYVLNAAIKAELYVLSTLAMLAAVISSFYYLKIIKMMYFDHSSERKLEHRVYTAENIIITAMSTTLNTTLILLPSSLSVPLSYYVSSLFN